MFNRHNAEPSGHLDNDTAGHHPERVETAEFTMKSSSEIDSPGDPASATSGASQIRVLDPDQIERRQAEWDELQAQFIDDPRRAVEQADQMISGTIDDITRSLVRERKHLEQDWKDVDDADTEELRITFRRYRKLLDRLLSV